MEQHRRAACGGTEKIGLLGLWEQTVWACYLVSKSGSRDGMPLRESSFARLHVVEELIDL